MNTFGLQQTNETIQANSTLWTVLHTNRDNEAEMVAMWAEKDKKHRIRLIEAFRAKRRPE